MRQRPRAPYLRKLSTASHQKKRGWYATYRKPYCCLIASSAFGLSAVAKISARCLRRIARLNSGMPKP
jgi:hypothetical protein